MRKSLVCLLAAFAASAAFAWSEGHRIITRRVLEVLSAEDRALFGDEAKAYAEHHSLIPDLVGRKDGSERYVWDFVGYVLTDDFGDPRFEGIHLYLGPERAYEVLSYYFRHAVEAGRAGRTDEFACFVGCFTHALEDWSCPAHSTADDNVMTRLQTYLPPPKGMEFVSPHSRLETGGFALDDVACAPEVLAGTPEELAFALLPRVERAVLAARATIVPMLEDVYRGDQKACEAKQKPSGARGLKLVADAVRTVCEMVRAQGAPAPRRPALSLVGTMPLEAKGLCHGQRQFVWDPYWGVPSVNCTFKDGDTPVPMAVMLEGKRTEIAEGLGFGSQHYSWFVPKGVFGRLTAVCGLHADLSAGGSCDVTVSANGKALERFRLTGGGEARRLDLPIAADVSSLEVRVAGDLKARKTYFVFGNPLLHFK